MERPMTIDGLRRALEPLWRGGRYRLIVLFGSVATGRSTPESDLDVGVLASGPLDEIAVGAEIVRLTHWNDVDVLDLSRADPLTAFEIARHGVVLFAADATVFPEFCSLAVRRYGDTEKLRLAERRALDLFQERHEPD